MSHTSEKRWPEVADIASNAAKLMVDGLLEAESQYQDLLELYAYCGNTAQGLADQLFIDVWQIRSVPGTPASITIDVAAGTITDAFLQSGGAGYTDGTGFQYVIDGGDGDGVLSYDVVAGAITNVLVVTGGGTYPDGLGQTANVPSPSPVFDTQANAAEVQLAQDLIDAMTAIHEIYQAADNGIVGQEDRLVQMRRFT